MKKLPIGIQDLGEMIENDYLYIDKTKYVYNLISRGKYYFLSRPRRFGKSLLVSTLKELFSANKELFRELWIYDKIQWKEHPIIHIDFSNIGHKSVGLEKALDIRLHEIADSYNIKLEAINYVLKFKELIQKLSKKYQNADLKSQVVLLVDEYDKPIIDFVDDISRADANREILKNFYSIIKGCDKFLEFVFLTGVSKFTQVSIFSDLNQLDDITIDRRYSTMLGYTQKELEYYFADYIAELTEEYENIFPNILAQIKEWYNGYSWDGKNFVYNPFSILNLFSKRIFDDYWFKTATPTFLLKVIKDKKYTALDLENKIVDTSLFNKYEVTDIEVTALLFQAGYLTIKEANWIERYFVLDYPNKEVALSFESHLLAQFSQNTVIDNSSLLRKLTQALKENEIDSFIQFMQTLFSGIAYPIIEKRESYYHSIFYLVVKLLGFNIQCEILTSKGRIDALLQTESHIYVIEFKIGDGKTALQQIKEKEYHAGYMDGEKPITLLGIGFDAEEKNIGSYETERIKN